MSRFVSAGTDKSPTERDEAWLRAQVQIEATRARNTAPGEQQGGKSLYETLQANKAAKQEAFEEATRLRNQFRTLDEDEVDFLDSVLESTRNKEAEVRQETTDQLEAFRQRKEAAEKAAKLVDDGEDVVQVQTWSVVPKKRKKGREKEAIGGVKLRRTSTAKISDAEQPTSAMLNPEKVSTPNEQNRLLEPVGGAPTSKPAAIVSEAQPSQPNVRPLASELAAPPPVLGLGAYSSDEDD
ncbi:hypothetical protein BAUCODRAFT_61185 [Baudoinia panamericana UAMH 10762]|uniref:FAM192A/Fyv6 N-terminal domain-containing protein n=1 Tax=Baudoinia panamericana (strain UAMH 10762) TaxID=717646 RepID=M2NNV2_BAUPA|nr:uncharacterized protein BAUCODRAFT_61185 [Baudoinia panamericana UAMH 10762]EMD00916.1 hypothetical protein BAUCODRAFT_61185 [Baudoinia panamericana UAMH 10762]